MEFSSEVLMLAYLFVIFALAIRFLPHPMAFTPVVAALLFFGARGPRRRMWLPLALFAASDVLLTTLVYRYPLTWDHFVTWAWYVGVIWMGTRLRAGAGPVKILVAALAGSLSFFLLSNFAVWAVWRDMYPMSFTGLMECYDAGLPFFRRAVEGDLLFTAAMFAIPGLLHALSGQFRKSDGDHIAPA